VSDTPACRAHAQLPWADERHGVGPVWLVPWGARAGVSVLRCRHPAPCLQSAVLYLVAHASRAFMTSLNSVSVEGAEHLAAALQRQPGVPLVSPRCLTRPIDTTAGSQPGAPS